jgi:hypothetical protein
MMAASITVFCFGAISLNCPQTRTIRFVQIDRVPQQLEFHHGD